MYKHIIRPALSLLPAETAHNFALACLGAVGKIKGGRALLRLFYSRKTPHLAREVFGIKFPNPIGLAAGMDRNGDLYNEFKALGFGFVEIGSLTPRRQKGNAKPRIFRVSKDKAIINNLGSDNLGIYHAINHLKTDNPNVIIAANIERGLETKSHDAIIQEFRKSFSIMYDYVDMFTINISNPINRDDTKLQDMAFLSEILDPLLDLRLCYDDYKPILVKISPDSPKDIVADILDWCMFSGIDGIVACNSSRQTTCPSLSSSNKTIENGAVSGAPLFEKSLDMVKFIHAHTKGRLPIIGVGGIMTSGDAKKMLDAGASLIEIYSGLVYEGPSVVKKILRSL